MAQSTKLAGTVVLLLLFCLFPSCEEDDPVVAPTVTTTAVTQILQRTATAGGSITSDGNGEIIVGGIVYSISTSPELKNALSTSDGSRIGSFSSSLTGLTPGTTYFVRAYATNSAGTGYGPEVSFTTLPEELSEVTTGTASDITINSAKVGGQITKEGTSPVTERGVVFSTNADPTVSSSKVTSGMGAGAFTASLTNLTPNTTYFAKAYSITTVGTTYGSELSFKTLPLLAEVETAGASNITSATASIQGTVVSDGSDVVTERGVAWSTITQPTLADTKLNSGTGLGTFTITLTGLSPGTTYFARAYATTAAGTAFGNEITFTTLFLPTLASPVPSDITGTTASIAANVTAANGTVSSKGVVWSTSANPTIALATKTTNGAGAGAFTASLTGLSSSTRYFVRAYATNENGTAYSTEIDFTTAGQQNLAIALDGVDDFISIPHSSSLNLGNQFTLEAWVYVNSAGSTFQTFLHKWQTTQYTLELYENEFNFVASSGTEIVVLKSKSVFPRDRWTHIAGVKDASAMRIYQDGVQVASVATTISLQTALSGPLVVGRRSENASNPLDGKIDEVRIWNAARTAAQIDANRYADLTGTETGLVAYYPLKSSATADASNSGVTAITDFSLSGNHGVLTSSSLSGSASNWTTNAAAPTNTLLPAGMTAPYWFNLAGAWWYSIDSDATGKYILTDNTFFYYYPWNVTFASGVYTVITNALDGTARTFYLKQETTDTNTIHISQTSSTTDFTLYGKVVGRTVNRVTHAGGSFNRTSGTAWVEKDPSGTITYNFTETGRDDWSVYLTDNQGRGNLQIDIYLKSTFWTPTGGTKNELYPLTGWFND